MNKRKAFTIVELLTSIAIIALLLGLLLPSIASVRRMAKEAAQKAQFMTFETALDAFRQDFGDYPPSDWQEGVNPPGRDYPGSLKLAEALVGWDLMGFDPNTVWRRDGLDASGGGGSYDPLIPRARGAESLYERKGPYLEVATTKAFHIGDLFNVYGSLDPCNFVLCDAFGARKITDNSGKIVTAGSPILYYRANTAYKTIYPTEPINNRIYNYTDNKALLDLGKLTPTGAVGKPHPLGFAVGTDYPVFYGDKYTFSAADAVTYGTSTGYGIKDPKIPPPNAWPYRPDSYILISAGADGLYGTADDIHNY